MSPEELSLAEISHQLQSVPAPPMVFAYLLGSAATPRFRADSDIDLAVSFDDMPSSELRFALQNSLAEKWGRDVDLIHLNQADPILRRAQSWVSASGERKVFLQSK